MKFWPWSRLRFRSWRGQTGSGWGNGRRGDKLWLLRCRSRFRLPFSLRFYYWFGLGERLPSRFCRNALTFLRLALLGPVTTQSELSRSFGGEQSNKPLPQPSEKSHIDICLSKGFP